MGVYVGIQQMEYGNLAAPHLSTMGPFSATGGPFSVSAGRLSFTFGFKGPAVSLLLAVRLWMQALPLLSLSIRVLAFVQISKSAHGR